MPLDALMPTGVASIGGGDYTLSSVTGNRLSMQCGVRDQGGGYGLTLFLSPAYFMFGLFLCVE